MNTSFQKVGRNQVAGWKTPENGEEGEFVSLWRTEAADNVSETNGVYDSKTKNLYLLY